MVQRRQQKPAPIGTIIGVVVCLGGILAFLLLLNAGVINTNPKQPPPPPPGPVGTTQSPTPPSGDQPQFPPGTQKPPEKPPSQVSTGAPGEVRVAFDGSFEPGADTRKIVYRCPFCSVEILDVRIPSCPSCGKALKWPATVPCKFCNGTGTCPACSGDKKCPKCGKGVRMLMGVRPPCEYCRTTGECPACSKTGKCSFCQDGVFTVGGR